MLLPIFSPRAHKHSMYIYSANRTHHLLYKGKQQTHAYILNIRYHLGIVHRPNERADEWRDEKEKKGKRNGKVQGKGEGEGEE